MNISLKAECLVVSIAALSKMKYEVTNQLQVMKMNPLLITKTLSHFKKAVTPLHCDSECDCNR